MAISHDNLQRGERDESFPNAVQRRERVTAAVILVLGWATAYGIWPGGVTENTVAQIIPMGLVRLIASAFTGIVFSVVAAVLWL